MLNKSCSYTFDPKDKFSKHVLSLNTKFFKEIKKSVPSPFFLSVTIDLTQLIYACKESIPLLAYSSLPHRRKIS